MTGEEGTTKYAKGAKREAKLLIMATNLQIDDSLIQKAVKLGGAQNKKGGGDKSSRRIHRSSGTGKNPEDVRNGGVRPRLRLQRAKTAIMKIIVDQTLIF
jgi:Arc/MetJ family transcription regulator